MQRFYQIAFWVFALLILIIVFLQKNRFPDFNGISHSGGESIEQRNISNGAISQAVEPRPCNFGFELERPVHCAWYFTKDKRVRIPIVVFKAKEQTQHLPLLFLGGGPGQGGQTAPERVLFWSDWLRETQLQRDLVIFDYRGNSPGQPFWTCEAFSDLTKDMLEDNLSFEQEGNIAEPVIEACLKTYQYKIADANDISPEHALSQFSTRQNARDSTQIMKALGYKQWHVFAVSYGGRVALTAAHEFSGVKSLILDSPYTFASTVTSSPEKQLHRDALALFFQDCESQKECAMGVEDIQVVFSEVKHQLDQSPLPLTLDANGQTFHLILNSERLSLVFFDALYDHLRREDIMATLIELRAGQVDRIKKMAEMLIDQSFDKHQNTMLYYATECNDRSPNNEAPDSVVQHCQVLPKPIGLPEMKALDLPTIIIGGEFDPVVGVSNLYALRSYLTRSLMFVAENGEHGSFYNGRCDYDIVEHFLSEPEKFVTGRKPVTSRGRVDLANQLVQYGSCVPVLD